MVSGWSQVAEEQVLSLGNRGRGQSQLRDISSVSHSSLRLPLTYTSPILFPTPLSHLVHL